MLAKRLQTIQPSTTLALNKKASELKAQGRPIINLTVGEPDFDTPEYIKEAAIHAIKQGETKYTDVDGTPLLKSAIQKKFEEENHLHYKSSEIIVSAGAKMSIYLLCQTLLNPGDEVIIPAPYWVSYPDLVKLAEATPVIISTDIHQYFKITPEQLEQAITDKTKLFFINSPSNPSGQVYSIEELKALGGVLEKHPNVMIMTDDIYEHLYWHETIAPHILTACPKLKNRTTIINGVSKTYAMTGWRIGYAVGDERIISGMKKIQSQSTSNPTSIAQAAATEALMTKTDDMEKMIRAFKERHDFLYDAFSAFKGVNVIPSEGTFYLFPDFSAVINKMDSIKNDIDLSEWLLEKANVAVVPGSAFGMPGALRFSFATSLENLKKAVENCRDAIYRVSF